LEDRRLAGQNLTRNVDARHAEPCPRELPLRQIDCRQGQLADRLPRLEQRNARKQQHACGNAADDQLAVEDPGKPQIAAGTPRKIDEWDRKSTWIDKLGIGECLGAYLLQLASSTIQVTRSSNEWPACRACSGARE